MKPLFVVDCSVIMAWLFADEENAFAEALLERLRDGSALIPDLCHLETANVLLLAERKKRITRAQTAQLMTLLQELPLLTDEEPAAKRAEQIISLGRDYGLTAYDAAYLELALRASLPLATLDERLRQAANSAGLPDLEEAGPPGRAAVKPAQEKARRTQSKPRKKRTQ